MFQLLLCIALAPAHPLSPLSSLHRLHTVYLPVLHIGCFRKTIQLLHCIALAPAHPLSPHHLCTGYIRLELPVFHIGYFRNTIQLLQCICKSCSRVLLPDDERKQWLRRFRNPRVERVQREGMFKKVWGGCGRCGEVCTRVVDDGPQAGAVWGGYASGMRGVHCEACSSRCRKVLETRGARCV